MRVTTVIVGAGHAGLAMSHRLTQRSIDHVVLERGEVANSWRTERWDSLRLLTPNAQNVLPGETTEIAEPDGFLSMPEVVGKVAAYAGVVGAPVQSHTTVHSVQPEGDGYRVTTDRGIWTCASVVVATGPASVATVPAVAGALPDDVDSITPMTYRTPDRLDEGGVLVVGASATGAQLADELRRSGREVTLAVGEHVRMPRRYRGHDVFWWLDAAGVLDERADDLDDLVRARNLPSPQLVGSATGRAVDLNSLRDRGVRLAGRLAGIRDGVAQFSGSLANVCRLADLKMNRLLTTFDEWADGAARLDGLDAPERFDPTVVDGPPLLEVDLAAAGIRTVVWATGYRPDHSWLDLPVFDRKGRIRHRGGVVEDAPGVYVTGLGVLRRRGSTFLRGAALDSADLAGEVARHLDDHAGTMAALTWPPAVSATC